MRFDWRTREKSTQSWSGPCGNINNPDKCVSRKYRFQTDASAKLVCILNTSRFPFVKCLKSNTHHRLIACSDVMSVSVWWFLDRLYICFILTVIQYLSVRIKWDRMEGFQGAYCLMFLGWVNYWICNPVTSLGLCGVKDEDLGELSYCRGRISCFCCRRKNPTKAV